MEIKLKKLKEEVVIPKYAHPGDAGLDLYSLENYELKPQEFKIFLLGFALEFSKGYAAIIKDRSSLPINGQVHTMGGVIDAGYRGEYTVMLMNLSDKPYKIEKGDKIAQLIIFPIAQAQILEVDSLSNSSRGEGRFGSTGKK